jgi:gliding motility-associated-like protein
MKKLLLILLFLPMIGLTQINDYALYIPSNFTPNGDQLNETFLPKGVGIKNYTIEVYSRRGDLLFTSKDIEIGWGGLKENGQKMPAGTYVYYIETKNIYGDIFKLWDMITLR